MGNKVYKINESIKIVFQALGGQTGITDLSMIVYDPSNNASDPVILTEVSNGLYESTFIPDEIGKWWVKITSLAYPENGIKESYLVGNSANPPDELNTKIGEVQETPTQYTLLGRLKDLWDKLNDLFSNGNSKIKLWDGTNQAYIDSTGHQIIAGKSNVGVAPSSYPVSISGVDTNGFKRHFLTDENGKLFTVNPATTSVLNIPVQIGIGNLFSTVNNGEWQEILEYTVPNGYDLSCVLFDATSGVANEEARVIFKQILGSYNTATNTFTDGESLTAPRFDNKMFIYVTTQIGSGANDIITITYTNQDGIEGRTATVTIPKNSLVGTRIEITLQTGDYGIRDVTNVTHTQTDQAGEFNIEGILSLFYLGLTSSNVMYSTSIPPIGAITVAQGEKLYLQFRANSLVTNSRRLNLTATLVPR